jgi:ParB family chromosome partitioning protein
MEKFAHLSVDRIVLSRWNCNYMSEKEFEELKQAIRLNGIEPIIVRPKNDWYEVIDGEHRFRAVKELGFTSIPAIVVETDDEDAKARTIVYNIIRGRIDYIKLSEIILEEFKNGSPPESIATKYFMNIDDVNKLLELEKLAPETKAYIQDTIRRKNTNITLQHLVLIANTPKEYQQTIAQATINYQLSTPELKALIQLYTTETTKQKTKETQKETEEQEKEIKAEIGEIGERGSPGEKLRSLLKHKKTLTKATFECECGRIYTINFQKRRIDKLEGTQQEYIEIKAVEENGKCPVCNTQYTINYQERKITFKV